VVKGINLINVIASLGSLSALARSDKLKYGLISEGTPNLALNMFLPISVFRFINLLRDSVCKTILHTYKILKIFTPSDLYITTYEVLMYEVG
jgi:hypothetical protein